MARLPETMTAETKGRSIQPWGVLGGSILSHNGYIVACPVLRLASTSDEALTEKRELRALVEEARLVSRAFVQLLRLRPALASSSSSRTFVYLSHLSRFPPALASIQLSRLRPPLAPSSTFRVFVHLSSSNSRTFVHSRVFVHLIRFFTSTRRQFNNTYPRLYCLDRSGRSEQKSNFRQDNDS
jgi:hypothetical protein